MKKVILWILLCVNATTFAQQKPLTVDEALQKIFGVSLQAYRDSFGIVDAAKKVKIDRSKVLCAIPKTKEFPQLVLVKEAKKDLLSAKELKIVPDEELKNYQVISYFVLDPVSHEDLKAVSEKSKKGEILTDKDWMIIKKRLILHSNEKPAIVLEVGKL
ncbi:hypothetical protein MWN41_10320 [Ornithobacterium rhinotracheale]|uniref:hypothetical protein n=1 Tax=Ornithobacterium rhinotracheale TaxID=28251 RepID=UPI001FF43DFF|nr:hypothetical protein [Ornithobacterium rhinotracheale]MCK0203405.1 hypothetical protein [Ornithobacterium rhinotracheale]